MVHSPEISQNREDAKENKRKVDISLPALEDEHRDILDQLTALQSSVIRSETEVRETEALKTEENNELTANNTLLAEKNNGIKEKDDGITEKKGTIDKNEGTIAKNAKRIEVLRGQKTSPPATRESPESVEAVNGSNNQTTNSTSPGESSENAEAEIARLEAENTKLATTNKQLSGEIKTLNTEREVLVAARDVLQNTTIPANQAEIARLTELGQEQEKRKNDFIAQKNAKERENTSLSSRIEAMETQIAGVATQIAESQRLIAQNFEERPSPGFFEPREAGDFGIWPLETQVA